MSNNIVLTADQFRALLRTITDNNGGNDRELPSTMSGNFAGCKSRFSGARGENVEAFIDAILIYKVCVNVSDENALKGLPMLFDGMAATWWQGAKASNTTWEDAVTSLCHGFGERKPNFKVFLQPGLVRSQCPKAQGNHEENPASLSVLATDFHDENSRPMLEITIAGLHGLAFVDTCAKRNVAGQKLYQYFREIDIPRYGSEEMMTIADGIARLVQTETFVVDVELRGVLVQVSFTAVPEHLESKIVLGVPFIKKTGIVLNIPQMQWWFTQNPNVVYKLEREPVNMGNTMMVNAMQIEEFRPEEGIKLTEEEKEELSELRRQNTDVFEEQADATLSYVLKTDATSYAIGGCLLQGEGTDERPVEYTSWVITEAKRNYSPTEREAVAVVHNVQKFRGYLEGRKVQVSMLVEAAHDKWSSLLPSVRLAMNSAVHASIGHEDLRANIQNENSVLVIIPYLNTIAESLKDAREMFEHQQDKPKGYDDIERRPRERWKINSASVFGFLDTT